MAQRRYTTTFAIALVGAAGAIFGIQRALEAPKAHERIPTRLVVVSLQDISEGRTIERSSVAVARWPVGTVPAGAYAVVDSVLGRVARVKIFKGQVLVPGRVRPDSAAGSSQRSQLLGAKNSR
jgi:pilus assembly protein CpaB